MKNDKHYTKPFGWGAYTPEKLLNTIDGVRIKGRKWARPVPYWSFIERLRQAYDVLTYRADALYWKERYEK